MPPRKRRPESPPLASAALTADPSAPGLTEAPSPALSPLTSPANFVDSSPESTHTSSALAPVSTSTDRALLGDPEPAASGELASVSAPSTATPGLAAQLPPTNRETNAAASDPTRENGRQTGEVPTTDEPTISLPLQELLERIPKEPGVYLMKDKKGRIIYVGKATNLRQRVRSYFNRSGDSRAFVRLLNRLLGDIETVVVSNEKEALLLENNLIKQHKPRFNVKLVDDKSYLVLRLDPKARYPRLEVTRRIRDDSARYFGPYHSATSCRHTLRVVNRHFKLRTCTDQVLNSRKRPCLQYQIKRCDAPCVFPVPAEQYGEQVRDVALFLDRKDDVLTERLRDRMLKASDNLEFETAAALRDQLRALEQTLQEQHAVSTHFVDQDVYGYYREGDVLEIAVLFVRQGRLLGRRTYRFTGQEFPDEESISSFIGLYYDRGAVIPDEVLLPVAIEDLAAKQEWLRDKSDTTGGRRSKVVVVFPQRGPRAKLVELANKNAAASYVSRRDKTRDTEEALVKLQQRLGLKQLPRRIECFDISHLQGSFTVASRVVFIDGEPARHLYRTFRVRSVFNDDFAAMYEVLSRRFRRALGTMATSPPVAPTAQGSAALPVLDPKLGTVRDLDEETQLSPATLAARRSAAVLPSRPAPSHLAQAADAAPVPTEEADPELDEQDPETDHAPDDRDAWALPDLLVIDGGKGQLATALAALKDVGVSWSAAMDVVGLAKERELGEAPAGGKAEKTPDRVFLPRTKDPIKLRPNTAELFVLSRIRDEAHRFAVTFHQKLREKGTIRSQLADIPGVGPKRQTALLKTLGSVRKVRVSTVEELTAVPGMTLRAAQAVVAFYASGVAPDPGPDPHPAPPAAPGPSAAPSAGSIAAPPTPRPTRRGRAPKSLSGPPEGLDQTTSPETAAPPTIAPVPEQADDIAEDAAAVELAELAGSTDETDADTNADEIIESAPEISAEIDPVSSGAPDHVTSAAPREAAKKGAHDKFLADLSDLHELESQIADLAQASAVTSPDAPDEAPSTDTGPAP